MKYDDAKEREDARAITDIIGQYEFKYVMWIEKVEHMTPIQHARTWTKSRHRLAAAIRSHCTNVGHEQNLLSVSYTHLGKPSYHLAQHSARRQRGFSSLFGSYNFFFQYIILHIFKNQSLIRIDGHTQSQSLVDFLSHLSLLSVQTSVHFISVPIQLLTWLGSTVEFSKILIF